MTNLYPLALKPHSVHCIAAPTSLKQLRRTTSARFRGSSRTSSVPTPWCVRSESYPNSRNFLDFSCWQLSGFSSPVSTSTTPVRQGCSLQQLRFSRHPYKPRSREIFRPNIPGPENLPTANRGYQGPKQSFFPINYYPTRAVEALRSGENLGEDAPWNLLPWKLWKRRKYNVKTEVVPWMLSEEKGVSYHKRLNVWTAQWTEDGAHRIRRFRAAFGLLKAKNNAERFRRDLEATGRVDNRRTVKQRRLVHIQRRDELRLRKKRFAKIASGQF